MSSRRLMVGIFPVLSRSVIMHGEHCSGSKKGGNP
jgi:hypothetical protein